ncbi:universal stress protein [Lacinutrix sp. Bg11-31]|uniref:universal stress protein n=1 Tax=Lacinutrix sp. Bg11-31 TaxID=2057808 RepID=UPI000C3160A8|nr:universal stress protein [Lacinutrix sp. Bg11-31]AUC81160.1 universal stress protein [Lacinutrix sp. Bg11-31]
MKRILLPTDFSKNSKNAIDYAMALCKKWECTFYILNVQKQSEFILDDLIAAPANSSVHTAIAKDNKEELNCFLSKIKKLNTNKNFTFKPLFDFDSLTNAINQVVTAKEIDLVIMGTNGVTGAKETVFGSNTLNVIRKVNCPILTIPENHKFSTIESILFSTEDCKDFNKDGIKPLTDILSVFKAELSVLDLDFANYPEVQDNHTKCLTNLFNEQPFKYYSVTQVPSIMVISTITQIHNYNIHALFIEAKSFFERFLFGSNVDEISYNSTLPLLILRK